MISESPLHKRLSYEINSRGQVLFLLSGSTHLPVPFFPVLFSVPAFTNSIRESAPGKLFSKKTPERKKSLPGTVAARQRLPTIPDRDRLNRYSVSEMSVILKSKFTSCVRQPVKAL